MKDLLVLGRKQPLDREILHMFLRGGEAKCVVLNPPSAQARLTPKDVGEIRTPRGQRASYPVVQRLTRSRWMLPEHSC